MEDQSNSLLSKNPIGVFSKLAGLAHFPSEKMPLIDLYIETAAGNQNHCALVGNYFIRASTSVIIREKHQVPERDTYRSPAPVSGRLFVGPADVPLFVSWWAVWLLRTALP